MSLYRRPPTGRYSLLPRGDHIPPPPQYSRVVTRITEVTPVKPKTTTASPSADRRAGIMMRDWSHRCRRHSWRRKSWWWYWTRTIRVSHPLPPSPPSSLPSSVPPLRSVPFPPPILLFPACFPPPHPPSHSSCPSLTLISYNNDIVAVFVSNDIEQIDLQKIRW